MEKQRSKSVHRRICFVSLNVYPLLAGVNMGYVAGGAEKRLALLAKELVKRNFEVSFVTYGNGAKSVEYIDNIRVIKVYTRQDITKLNPIKKAWYIWRALKDADADIYIESPGSTGVVSVFCRLQRRISILSIASDDYVEKHSKLANMRYNNILRKVSIRLSNMIVVQSEYQRNSLSRNFMRKSIIIKNPCLLSNKKMLNKQTPPLVIWVAELKKSKRAELFLELAKAIPEARFELVGGVAMFEEEYFYSIQEMARRIPNLCFVGFIPQYKIGSYFARASILVNTSVVEGFPNTFLEAWAEYTPVVSLNIDPDEIICRSNLGFHSHQFHQMVVDVRKIINNESLRDEMGINGRRYVEEEHNINKIVDEYIALFQRLIHAPKCVGEAN